MAKSHSSKHPMDSYIQQRKPSGNYQFRRAVPDGLRQAIGKGEIFKSLKTSEHLIALRRAQTEFDETERLFAAAKSGELINLDVDFSDVANIDNVLAQLAAARANLVSELSVEDIDETSLVLEYQNAKSQDTLEGGRKVLNQNIHLPASSPLYESWQRERQAQVLTAIAGQIKEGRQRELDALNVEDLGAFESLIFKGQGQREKPTPTVWAVYLDFKAGKLIDNTDEERTRFDHIVSNFISFVGSSTPLNYVTRKQVIEFFRLLANYPPRLTLEQRKLSFVEITAGVHKKTISKTTSKEWLRRLNRLFAYGVNAYSDAFKVANPFVGMEEEPKGREPLKKRPWNPDEIAALFSQPEFGKRDSFFWSLVCAVHHGNRLSEFHRVNGRHGRRSTGHCWKCDPKDRRLGFA